MAAITMKNTNSKKKSAMDLGLAGTTGLEPATSDVTGRRSNQLNYVPALFVSDQNNIPSPVSYRIADARGANRQRSLVALQAPPVRAGMAYEARIGRSRPLAMF
jgi:hypothetical protein